MPFRFNSTHSEQRMRQILESLKESPKTAIEISGVLGLSEKSGWQYLRHMHDHGRIHISGWRYAETHPCPSAMYSAGNRPDKRRPRAKTRAEICRDFRKRLKTDPARDLARLVTRRKREAKQRLSVALPIDPLLAWIPRRETREAA